MEKEMIPATEIARLISKDDLESLLHVLQSVSVTQLDFERVATFKIDIFPGDPNKAVHWLNQIEEAILTLAEIVRKQHEALLKWQAFASAEDDDVDEKYEKAIRANKKALAIAEPFVGLIKGDDAGKEGVC